MPTDPKGPGIDPPIIIDPPGAPDDPQLIRGGHGNNLILGAGGDDVISGGGGSDIISGGGDDDIIRGGRGDDLINGGRGLDRAAYAGDLANYSIWVDSNGRLHIQDIVGSDGHDILKNVETFNFNGTIYTYFDITGLAFSGI